MRSWLCCSCTCGTWCMCTFRSAPVVHCVIKTPTASLGCIHTLKASQLFGNNTRARGKHPFLFFRSSGLNVTLYLKMWNVHERYTCCTSCPRDWLVFGEDKKTTKRAPTVPSKLLPILRPSVTSWDIMFCGFSGDAIYVGTRPVFSGSSGELQARLVLAIQPHFRSSHPTPICCRETIATRCWVSLTKWQHSAGWSSLTAQTSKDFNCLAAHYQIKSNFICITPFMCKM